jgi:hypothetical protein
MFFSKKQKHHKQLRSWSFQTWRVGLNLCLPKEAKSRSRSGSTTGGWDPIPRSIRQWNSWSNDLIQSYAGKLLPSSVFGTLGSISDVSHVIGFLIGHQVACHIHAVRQVLSGFSSVFIGFLLFLPYWLLFLPTRPL